ncbi:hypothetical protein CHLRE_07g332950v5 [Chlamydomonas reinhardtii]|uniref:SF-assemblin n=3 Tax=Chlamydomonas reinhardtii TaxID=3055 RepID=SFAS_CHLRE|nr:uncharacterized protein CHLRE_07g332950v5 [Chlamydomonas reinhardtii]Q39618.1 RecName: Full=SF-assemblin [Chlamydomonas reinhardtii]AAB03789.1 SF-assemblin [Chlamydomonas reinhardtii]PNW80868.1 hypothetical protein CHLRE_07g332950v5 [Chlamydomonas reinhardtii]CAC69239.1 striated fiber assemblin [Chlamydomonas reinhardtii]|eukprot:XP_001690415.1 SF-assemblin [Chlamydomonas reinhardtii]
MSLRPFETPGGLSSLSPRRRDFSPTRPGTNGPSAKLEHVTERFAGLWTDLEQEKQNKRIQESTRFSLLQESLQRIEKSVEAEVKRRAESDKQLQSHFEGEIKTLQERQLQQFTDLQLALKSAVESLNQRITDLHALVRDERESRRSDIEHLATSLVGKVNECVAAIDEERNGRVQEQTVSMKRVGEDLMLLSQRLDTEKNTRDSEVSALRAEVHDAIGNRNLADDQFKGAVLDEVAGLKAALALEREERIAEDDEIVQAVNDYTKALQEGLKLVSA